MRINEERIYCPPAMIEKPGGLQIKGSGIRDGRSCSLHTALHYTVVEADAAHCRVALYTSVVTIAAGHIGKLEYPGHIEELKYPGHIGEIGYQGHTGKLEYPGHIGELKYPGHIGEK